VLWRCNGEAEVALGLGAASAWRGRAQGGVTGAN